MVNKIFFSIVIVALSLVLLGCISGEGALQAKLVGNGSKVTVDYVGSFQNGTVFDTSIAAEAQKAGLAIRNKIQPLVFVVGDGTVIPGFEKAVVGLKEGEEKITTIAPDDGYGYSNPENIVTINATLIDQSGGEPKAGMLISTSTGARGVITKVAGGNVTIDFNPPLAGKTLVFKIIMQKIE